MAENREPEQTTGEELESAANVTTNAKTTIAQKTTKKTTTTTIMTAIEISDGDTKYPVREDDTRSIETTPLDKNLSDTLSKMVSRLCSICGNFFKGQSKIKLKSQQQDFSGTKVHHTSLNSLEESVKSGCPLCQDLFKTFEKRLKWDPVLQRFTARSSSIWCAIEPCEWEKLPRYGLIQEKRIRGLRMLFHARDQYGRELHATV